MKQIYLTDGVYATLNKDDIYPVVLTTGHHSTQQADNTVYLEWSALSMLINACKEESILTAHHLKQIGGEDG